MPNKPDPLRAPDFDALKLRAYNLRWATVDDGVIPLTAADPDLAISQEVIEAIQNYVAIPHLSYGPPLGLPAFRRAVAQHFSHEKNAAVAEERVLATNSAANAIALVASHLLRPGDEVVIQDPVDFLIAESARRAGATLRLWATDNGRFTLDGLREAVTERTRMVSVCHPHNPLGSLWSSTEVAAIAAFASERGIALLSDEVWSDVLLDHATITSFARHADMACAPWVIYGLSKGYGLAGLRIGAVIAPTGKDAAEFATAQGFEHTIEGAATLSQIAATAALERGEPWRSAFLQRCTSQRDLAVLRLRALPGIAIQYVPQATFVLFADVRKTGLDQDQIADELLKHAKVRVVPGNPRWFGPGAAGHIRLSLATTSEVLDEALTRIAQAWPVITG
jgi:aspartate/methionine/tyrosine aminotransferase